MYIQAQLSTHSKPTGRYSVYQCRVGTHPERLETYQSCELGGDDIGGHR